VFKNQRLFEFDKKFIGEKLKKAENSRIKKLTEGFM